jgi:hypothetical protein
MDQMSQTWGRFLPHSFALVPASVLSCGDKYKEAPWLRNQDQCDNESVSSQRAEVYRIYDVSRWKQSKSSIFSATRICSDPLSSLSIGSTLLHHIIVRTNRNWKSPTLFAHSYLSDKEFHGVFLGFRLIIILLGRVTLSGMWFAACFWLKA